MSAWLVAALGLAVLVLGLSLSWRGLRQASFRREFGAALVTGAIVSFVILFVQIRLDDRAAGVEERRRQEALRREQAQREQNDRQSLQLTVGLRQDLRGIDLRERDLTGFYLRQKLLDEARLDGARLAGAILDGSSLRRATLRNARFENASLDGVDLSVAHLKDATLRGASLVGAILVDADFTGADLRDADLRCAVTDGADFSEARTAGWQRLPPSDEACVALSASP